MNKNESRYAQTAAYMDEALLQLLEKKELPFITVKEICQKAGVNRSTFYLHYETINDLLEETTTYLTSQFFSYMTEHGTSVKSPEDLADTSPENLFFITSEYLYPYLAFIQEHQRVFRTALTHAAVLQLNNVDAAMFQQVFNPILDRFGVVENDRRYMMSFYVQGLMAIVNAWLMNDCKDSIEHIAELMQSCVLGPGEFPPNR